MKDEESLRQRKKVKKVIQERDSSAKQVDNMTRELEKLQKITQQLEHEIGHTTEIQSLFELLNSPSIEDMTTKIHEMKETLKKSKKDRHLLLNMKMLVRDCSGSAKILLKTVPFSAAMTGGEDEKDLPKAKEVWRWVKSMVQSYMDLLKAVKDTP